MAATDQHYRSQHLLDVIFGVSCGALLLTTVWMFVQDYNREFKGVQRTFRTVEAALAERAMIEQMPAPEGVRQRSDTLRDAREELEYVQQKVAPTDAELKARRERTDD